MIRRTVRFIACNAFICVLTFHVNAQNFIPNNSFENYSSCPSGNSQINYANPWDSASLGTPDYYNTCSSIMNPNSFSLGSQSPRTGAGVAGIAVFSKSQPLTREYIEVQLVQPLINNTTYYVEFFVNLADQCYYSVSRLGCFFSNSVINNNTSAFLSYTPQIEGQAGVYLSDKLGWGKVSGYYKSIGGEQFITIGNFYDDNNTDTLNVGNGAIDGAYYLIDDVTIMDSALVGVKEIQEKNEIKIYPNPVENQISIKNLPSESGKSTIIIYNSLGEKVLEQSLKTEEDVNQIDLSALKQGVYLYKIIVDNVSVKTERLVLVK